MVLCKDSLEENTLYNLVQFDLFSPLKLISLFCIQKNDSDLGNLSEILVVSSRMTGYFDTLFVCLFVCLFIAYLNGIILNLMSRQYNGGMGDMVYFFLLFMGILRTSCMYNMNSTTYKHHGL